MKFGDALIRLEDVGTPRERVVVERADLVILAVNELVDQWLRGESPHVTVYGTNVVSFGTYGQGQGRVSYEIGEPHGDDARVLRRVA